MLRGRYRVPAMVGVILFAMAVGWAVPPVPAAALAAEQAASLPAPVGPVLLTVTGAIAVGNQEAGQPPAARFDRAMIEALPAASLTTPTDWTEGPQRFGGVLLRDLLDRVGAAGGEIVATAINEYTAAIPRADLDRYPVLLALTRNGAAMPVRDKGPLWIVYPSPDPMPGRAGPHNSKMVWQLNRLEVR